MKRATGIGLLAGAVVLVVSLLLWSRELQAPVNVDEPYVDHVEIMSEAMKENGYEDTGLVGTQWKGKGCQSFTYLVQPMEQRLFAFTRDAATGHLTTLTGDQINEELHRHISFEGSFSYSTFPFGELGQFYYIGRVPDKQAADVYVRINPDACGFQIDRVAYRGSRRTDIANVSIQLLRGN